MFQTDTQVLSFYVAQKLTNIIDDSPISSSIPLSCSAISLTVWWEKGM